MKTNTEKSPMVALRRAFDAHDLPAKEPHSLYFSSVNFSAEPEQDISFLHEDDRIRLI